MTPPHPAAMASSLVRKMELLYVLYVSNIRMSVILNYLKQMWYKKYFFRLPVFEMGQEQLPRILYQGEKEEWRRERKREGIRCRGDG